MAFDIKTFFKPQKGQPTKGRQIDNSVTCANCGGRFPMRMHTFRMLPFVCPDCKQKMDAYSAQPNPQMQLVASRMELAERLYRTASVEEADSLVEEVWAELMEEGE